MEASPPVENVSASTPLTCPVDGCTKTFTRADHVRRHVSSAHQRALPFPCPVCHKRFGRRDLLKRHALKHEERSDDASSNREHKPRVRQACTACASKKLKCDGVWPCKRCHQKSVQCTYPNQDATSENPQPRVYQDTSPIMQQASPHPYRMAASGSSASNVSSPLATSSSATRAPPDPSQPMGTPDSGQQLPVNGTDAAYLGDVLDFGHVYNLDFNESDLSIFDNLDTDFQYMDPPPSNMDADNPKQQTNMFLIGGFEAFSKSLWYWNPHHQKQIRSRDERDSLHEPISNSGAGTIVKLGNEAIDQVTRDRFLMIVAESFHLTTAPPETGKTSFFPSEKILNDLLQFSLAEQYLALDSWVHNHFHHPKQSRLPLLASLVANGAVQSALPTVQKFGYAFQEAIRMKGPSVFEEDARMTRELSVWQSMMILLQIGLWSGIARKIEIAESFMMPVFTMIRRSGNFQADIYRPIHVSSSTVGKALQEQWHEFLHQESRKRLVLHCLIHDAQSSMSLQGNNIVSVAELVQVPLPAPCEIWQSESAEAWKSNMIRSRYNSSSSRPSIAQCVDDITHLVNVQYYVDVPLSALVILHGYWQMIFQHQQLSTLHSTSSSVVPSSTMSTLSARQHELTTLLKRFGDCIIPLVPEPPRRQIVLLHEVMTMYLHISLSELQVFAGKQGEQASRDAFNRLKSWISSPCSRNSVRHAAMVLRTATQLRSGSLRDFFAIAVYHASLTLWSYGTIWRAQRRVSAVSPSSGPQVILDEPENEALESYLATGHGTPCISIFNPDGSSPYEQPANLDNPPAVMKACLRVLEGNFWKLAEGLKMPLLVENLGKLMRDLGDHAFLITK